MDLHVGVLHYDPSFEPFPLLTDPVDYEPNTLNLQEDKPMLQYWLNVLSDSIQNIMAKAMASEGGTAGGWLPVPCCSKVSFKPTVDAARQMYCSRVW